MSDEWYEEFGEAFVPLEEEGDSAVRLIGEMFAAGVLCRDGDEVVGRGGHRLDLSTEDQYLVRRVEDAVRKASEATDEA